MKFIREEIAFVRWIRYLILVVVRHRFVFLNRREHKHQCKGERKTFLEKQAQKKKHFISVTTQIRFSRKRAQKKFHSTWSLCTALHEST